MKQRSPAGNAPRTAVSLLKGALTSRVSISIGKGSPEYCARALCPDPAQFNNFIYEVDEGTESRIIKFLDDS